MKKYKRIIDPVKHFNAWMRNILRRSFFRWYQRSEAVKMARVDRGLYRCANCLKIVRNKEFAVDHINPVVDTKLGFQNWDVYINRLFCVKENLQILCKPCHQIKCNVEKAERKTNNTGPSSVEARKKMSELKKGHHDNLGITKSLETKQKMSL